MKCDYCQAEFADNQVYVICTINAKEMHFCEEECKIKYEEEQDYIESDVNE